MRGRMRTLGSRKTRLITAARVNRDRRDRVRFWDSLGRGGFRPIAAPVMFSVAPRPTIRVISMRPNTGNIHAGW